MVIQYETDSDVILRSLPMFLWDGSLLSFHRIARIARLKKSEAEERSRAAPPCQRNLRHSSEEAKRTADQYPVQRPISIWYRYRHSQDLSMSLSDVDTSLFCGTQNRTFISFLFLDVSAYVNLSFLRHATTS